MGWGRWGGLHFAGRWAKTPEGSRLVLAVLVRLVEKHPESFIEQKPCWQSQQPLGERREEEGERDGKRLDNIRKRD